MRDLPLQDLEIKEKELMLELFNLKIRQSLNQLNNPVAMRTTRRDLARVKTLLAEKREASDQASQG
jgi:large subunit ribosomal protein L29